MKLRSKINNLFNRLQRISSSKLTSNLCLNFDDWFSNSCVKDTYGNPLVVFHATQNKFDVSEFLPLSHFGTRKAAEDLWGKKEHELHSVFLSIKNPLLIDDLISHSRLAYRALFSSEDYSHQVSKEITKKMFSDSELTQIFGTENIPNENWKNNLAKALLKNGYDGFIYKNEREDIGSTSYIILRSDQVSSTLGDCYKNTSQLRIKNNHF